LDASLQRSGPRLAVVMDPYLGRPLEDSEAAVPYAVPLLNLGQIYATQQGGTAADTFAVSPPTHHVLFRSDAEPFPKYPDRSYPILLAQPENRDDPNLRLKILSYVGSHAANFEDLILWGSAADADFLIARGFAADWREGGLMLAHFEGCPLVLNLESTSGLPPDARLEYGWYPLLEVANDFGIGGFSDAATSQRYAIPNVPCGPAWIRVTGSGAAPGQPPLRCQGADPQGRLLVADTRQTRDIECKLDPESGPRVATSR
jgi:hypothetical protein